MNPLPRCEFTWADMPIIYLAFGEKDQAIQCLEKGLAARDPDIFGYLFHDAILDSLRSDPRFADLVRRARLVRKAQDAANGRPPRDELAESADH